MKQQFRVIVLVAVSLLLLQTALANNVEVGNPTLTGQNSVSQFTLVQFDITWDNSWRVSGGPSNRDACWVFVKYSTDGVGIFAANANNTTDYVSVDAPRMITVEESQALKFRLKRVNNP